MMSEAREESLRSTPVALAAGTTSAVLVCGFLFGGRVPEEPADAVVLLVTVIAILLGGWWTANVCVWNLALRRGSTVRRFTLPGTRRLAQLLLVVSLSSACISDAGETPAMELLGIEATPDELVSEPTTTQQVATSPTEPTTTAPPPTSAPPPTTARADSSENAPTTALILDPVSGDRDAQSSKAAQATISAHQVIVKDGDNLWALATETLEQHGVHEPSSAAVAGYWRLVVAGNQVRSGDVDLIVPGETIEMPAYEPAA